MTHINTSNQARRTCIAVKFVLTAAVAFTGSFAMSPAAAQAQLGTRFDVKGLYAGMPAAAFLKAMGKSVDCQNTADLIEHLTQVAVQVEAGVKAYEAGDKKAVRAGATPEEVEQMKNFLPTVRAMAQNYGLFQKAGAVRHCETTDVGFTMAERPVKLTAVLSKQMVLSVNIVMPAEHWPAVSEALGAKYADSGSNWLRSQLKSGQGFFVDTQGQTVSTTTMGKALESVVGKEVKVPSAPNATVLTQSNVTFTMTEAATARVVGEAILAARKPKDI